MAKTNIRDGSSRPMSASTARERSRPTMNRATPELLAPASNLTAALTAFDCGADAVYVGLKKFNARERGENFSYADLKKLLHFARRKNRKVYVTLNTLIKETELADLVHVLGRLTVLRPDAVIVQDLGVVELVRKYFPELTLHASTQMAIHNSAGIAFLKELGIERVILERQVTLDELALIRTHTDVELETFVHGALCCCRSGTCLFSSWLGGWSGNRGKCKQPCRRRFYSEDGNGFFFSTSDLYSLDAIPELKRMGIDSFKIEGRLRQADYVRSVVTAYRMMLDADDDEIAATLPKAREILSGSLGRKWSAGFRDDAAMDTVIEEMKLGGSGRLLGVVSSTGNGSFTLTLRAPLKRGDRVRVQPPTGDEGATITVEALSVDGRQTGRAKPKQTCTVACNHAVPRDGRVYLIGHDVQDMTDRIQAMPALLAVVDLAIRVSQSELSVGLPAFDGLSWRHELDLEPAQRRALSTDDLVEQFGKSGEGLVGTGTVVAEVDGEYFMPASVLKSLRRTFFEWLEETVTDDRLDTMVEDRVTRAVQACVAPFSECPHTAERTIIAADATRVRKRGELACVPLGSRLDGADEVVLPDFCPETDVSRLRRALAEAISKGVGRVRVTSLYGLQLASDFPELTVVGGFPLPVANTAALGLLLDVGVSKATIWAELEKAAVQPMIDRAGNWLETIESAVLPILSTRAKVPAQGPINDGRGEAFTVVSEGILTNLYPDKAFALPDLGVSRVVDQRHRPESAETSSFNWEHELK